MTEGNRMDKIMEKLENIMEEKLDLMDKMTQMMTKMKGKQKVGETNEARGILRKQQNDLSNDFYLGT